MLKLKKILSYIAFGLISLVIFTYVVLQTNWGATQISRKISDYTPYYLSIGTISYNIRQPTTLELNHVIFGYGSYPALVLARQVTFRLRLGKYLLPVFKDISADHVILAPANLPIKPGFPTLLPKITLNHVHVLAGRKTPEFLASNIWIKFQPHPSNNNIFYYLEAYNLVYRDTELNNVIAEGEITKDYFLVNCLAGQLSLGDFKGNLSYSFQNGLQQHNIIYKF